ncbi:hypothetical protein GCM10011375_09120 [Hymenobacter qilianensis]|uniref:Uncharacterized protein n=1 Tax=Hymenobacter qilianensis TaxID=1385715 RepID=A0ACB5PNE5_9BACT|nr:hypothetical protein GCM10011375_09120 [Hymenobacter qilianensis]
MAGVGLAAAGLLTVLFSFVLANPNDYFFLAAGDGLQSYYVTAFYAFYDAGIHFSGMNYPFGENFTYPNLQPLIALFINGLHRMGLPAAERTIAITNLAALLGVWLTPLVIYAILRRLHMPILYAGLMALLIGFLSPQIQRLGAHMSLSYPCFVPILWYCILRMQEAPRQFRWYILFGVSSLLMGLVQVYFLACGCFFLLAHVLVLSFQRPRPIALLWRMALAALLPLVLFRSWLWLTDYVTDRPPNPYGFLVYKATPSGVFTPALSPMREVWTALLPAGDISFEGMSYVGLVATGVLLVSGMRVAQHVWKRRGHKLRLRRAMPTPLYTALWASGLLLIFSFGIPFIFPMFSGLEKYLGPLKQLRALGRFAWPFYFVFTTYTAYYLYRLWRYQRQRKVAVLALPWLPLLLLLWAGEAWINIATKAKEVAQGAGARAYMSRENNLLVQHLSWASRQPSDFQAILPLPYFNNGSDKIALPGSESSIAQVYKLSIATGLPQLSSYMPRASVGQVLQHVQLLSSPLLDKDLVSHFPSPKPILLLVAEGVLSPAEQRLVSLARPLISSPEVKLYELSLAALTATTRAQEKAKAANLLPTLPVRANGVRATTSKGVFLQSFDTSPDRRGRLGAGAFYEPAEKFSILYDGPVPAPADTGRYEVSVWIHGKMDEGYGNMQVKQYADGALIDHQLADARLSTDIDGDWVRVALPIRVKPRVDRLEVLYDNSELLVDDLLIRPLDTDVYWYDEQRRLILNGYSIEP